MAQWIEALGRRGDAAVLVTVASVKGSTPREPGAKMVVTREGIAGTIGGGHLEFKAIEIARGLLAGEDTAALHRFPLGASLGQCCGGLANLLFEPVPPQAPWLDTLAALQGQGKDWVTVTLAHGAAGAGKLIVTRDARSGSLGSARLDSEAAALARGMLAEGKGAALLNVATEPDESPRLCFFDPVRAPDFTIVLFGAGHVGKAVVSVLAPLPCRILWVDEREDEFPAQVPPNVAVIATDTPLAEVDAAPPGSHFLVLTHSHALDQALAERILRRTDFAYFGLIGSLSKRRQFERRMQARGVPQARFAAMTCPIGVPGIPGKEPAAIAIAVAAELLQLRAGAQALQKPQETPGRAARG